MEFFFAKSIKHNKALWEDNFMPQGERIIYKQEEKYIFNPSVIFKQFNLTLSSLK